MRPSLKPLSFTIQLKLLPVNRLSGHITLKRRMSSLSPPPDIAQPEFLYAEEPLSRYRLGGYHPASINEVLNDRYKILRKLGWGGYSTVWLVKDELTKKYASIKILTGEATSDMGSKLHELEFLQHTATHDPSHPGYSRIIHLLDHFHHVGPNGRHLCLVTDVLGESVQSLTTYTEKHNVHPVVIKGIVRQVLQGLDYLHKCGIVHTDLKLHNFLIEIDDMDSYVQRALDSSEAEVYPCIPTADGSSVAYVATTPLAVPFEDVTSFKPLKIKVADLGVSCWENKTFERPYDQVQHPGYRAPEVCIDAGWNSKCDIWTLGLLIPQMLEGRLVIPVMDSIDIRVIVFIHTCMFGNYPSELIKRGKDSAKYFKSDGSLIHYYPDQAVLIPKISDYLSRRERMIHSDDLQRLSSFLNAALSLLPEDRATAAQLLDHDWIKSETVILCK